MNAHPFPNNNHTNVNGLTQFAFAAAPARSVSLAGDFNKWSTEASPMHKGPEGVWHLGLPLKLRRYEYRFFADAVWCNDPDAQETVNNSMGTENCVRFV